MSTNDYLILAYGQKGTGKSTFGLSGEGTTWYAELDAGSYRRAVRGSSKIDPARIEKHEYFVPLTNLIDVPKIDLSMMGDANKGAVQFVHKFTGYVEKLTEFIFDYLDALKGDYAQYCIDTAGRLWDINQNATRQSIQDNVPEERQEARLKRLEYEEPNAQQSQIAEAAKISAKTLVMLAHEKPKWRGGKPVEGQVTYDGYDGLDQLVDIILHFSIEDRLPVAYVEDKPASLHGMRLVTPTLPYVIELLDCAAAIQRGGLDMPETPDEVLALGKVLA